MQSAIGTRQSRSQSQSRFGRGSLKHVVLGIGLVIGVIGISAATLTLYAGTSTAPAQRQAVISMSDASNYRIHEANLTLPAVASRPGGNYRIMEANLVLPLVATDASASIAAYRFLESNALPLPAAPTVTSFAAHRFLESNLLPASVVTIDQRLYDMNVLPGDAVQQLPPTGTAGDRY